ncbi:hypothetical protein BaRGS_00025446 [Batillaria attramentaria]|uniref:Arginyl-tRNA--protein transferase 1 n=1 Tax=Batillaria attramentaria TaxID=370345 RepID=A0ABD0K866_9CAEN
MASRERSIVEYFAEHEHYRCGYCGGKDTNYSHGMWAHALTVEDYQDLIDRGWRRSGKYCYKPTMNQMCCPHYTIRQDALNFRMSKSHKKTIKRVNRFLITGERPGAKEMSGDGDADMATEGAGGDNFISAKSSELSLSSSDIKGDMTGAKSVSPSSSESKASASQKGKTVLPEGSDNNVSTQSSSGAHSKPSNSQEKQHVKSPPKPGLGPDASKPRCRKAKEIRLEKRLNKTGQSAEQAREKSTNKNNQAKSLEDFLNEPLKAENPAHRLEIKLVRSNPKSLEFLASYVQAHKVYHKYQMVIHKDPPDKPNLKQYTRFLVDSPLQVKLVQTSPKSSQYRFTFKESFELFRKYQVSIHKEKESENTQDTYTSFLGDSPLGDSPLGDSPLGDSPLQAVMPAPGEGGLPQGYGSFHQQYILDGKIIAVGVVDVLPHCVSSVYLYYDPDYSFLSLGTYSALREIAFVRELQKSAQDLKWYYMGFYIHSCPKMRYKGQYYPSYLLCPESYSWIPIEKCLPKLEASAYARLEEEGKEDVNGNIDIDRVLVLHDREAMPYEVYRFMNRQARDEEEVKEYAAFVGRKCAERMLLFRK